MLKLATGGLSAAFAAKLKAVCANPLVKSYFAWTFRFLDNIENGVGIL